MDGTLQNGRRSRRSYEIEGIGPTVGTVSPTAATHDPPSSERSERTTLHSPFSILHLSILHPPAPSPGADVKCKPVLDLPGLSSGDVDDGPNVLDIVEALFDLAERDRRLWKRR